ncbi:MAG: hypothetical protein ACK4RF_01255 [Cyclobacteriaceae bacterium]
MKKVMIAMLIGMVGIASQVNAQVRPSVDQREAVVIASHARLRQAEVTKQRVEQARLNHQRIEQARINQARLKHERIKKARVKHARVKHARIKAAREGAADEQVGNQHPRRRYFHWMKRKRTAGQFTSENLPPGN